MIVKIQKKFIFLLLVCMMLTLLSFPAVSAENSDVGGYVLVSKTGTYSMYADMETGLFYVKNTENGGCFFSSPENISEDKKTTAKDKMTYKSHLIIDYIDREGFIYLGALQQANSTVACVNKGTCEVEKITNGIRVNYIFEDLSFTVPVEYTLNGDKLLARIVTKEIKEGKELKIVNIHLLPSFGAADWNENGYIFVPDGCGATIDFNSGKTNNKYNEYVYGEELSVQKSMKTENKETVRLPVFGLCKNNGSSFLGNIITGDGAASIAAVSGNGKFGYNLCYGILNYRAVSSDMFLGNSGKDMAIYRISEPKYNLNEFSVQYSLLDGENSNYMTLANVYRDYLIENKGLKKNDDAELLNLDTYGALETTANFLGFKYSKLISLTGYSDIETISKRIKSVGINSFSFRYIGWQNDGIYNKRIAESSRKIKTLGGNSGWKKLQQYLKKSDIDMIYDSDLVTFRKGSYKKSAITMFNKRAYQYQYMRSVYATNLAVDSWLLLKPQLIEDNADSYLGSVKEDIKYLSLSTLSNQIYSDFKNSKTLYRSSFPKIIEKVIEKYKKAEIEISGESANAYAAPYLNMIYSAPTKSSGYNIFDKEIPFYQLVFKGYVSMTSGAYQWQKTKDEELLRAVETGSALLFNCTAKDTVAVSGTASEDLYSTEYSLWLDDAARQYSEYSTFYNSVKGMKITAHSELMKNVVKTDFENGISVIVNYNEEDATYNGEKIDARSFATYDKG